MQCSPPCAGQRSPTVQMTPSLFQLKNFHTPFPISSLPGDRPPVWLCSASKTAECPPAHHSVSVRTLHRRNQHIRRVQIGFARTCPSCPNLFYLLTILCSSACCRRPCFVRRCFVHPRGFIHPVHLHFVSEATENLEAIFLQLRELILVF